MTCLICGKEFAVENENEPRICPKCWRCPKCGVDAVYDDKDEDSPTYGKKNVEGLIENDDEVRCYRCDVSWTFRGLEKAIMKKKDKVTCPTCHGRGSVDGSKIMTGRSWPYGKKTKK
jgi:DNA-directed RNA polymerase subunit RPC12/RpoP